MYYFITYSIFKEKYSVNHRTVLDGEYIRMGIGLTLWSSVVIFCEFSDMLVLVCIYVSMVSVVI